MYRCQNCFQSRAFGGEAKFSPVLTAPVSGSDAAAAWRSLAELFALNRRSLTKGAEQPRLGKAKQKRERELSASRLGDSARRHVSGVSASEANQDRRENRKNEQQTKDEK